ncbi:HPr family phosphocarrier protein [Pelolinea submarina]|uniref:Phosphocarrier protein n=1 Tax=Pelolinea submarina TaxID=913107 RepID=A0A347ZQC8_9CHLR|nr:HPr family phosphocarrier protein [Pelolinea submarina]REG06161.1 phosphocarrier protein [Pelolinea submarina]BBB47509.1 phosphocarrier protein [Pelolinea submarina]
MVETELTLNNDQGLHARPADLFVRTANKFKSDITVRNLSTGSNDVNAKSILRILSLGVYSGHTIQIMANGEDENQAIEEIVTLVNHNFE